MPGTYISPAETGLYYLQSRYYDPETGRFINADAVLGANKDILSYNLFAYCSNNSVNKMDPSGMAVAIGAVAILVVVVVIIFVATFINTTTSGSSYGSSALKEPLRFPNFNILENKNFKPKTFTDIAPSPNILPKPNEKQKENNYQYWAAFRSPSNTVIVTEGLTYQGAQVRLMEGYDVMCINRAAAEALMKPYRNKVGPERHGGKGYYNHFHVHRNSKMHIWYYGE